MLPILRILPVGGVFFAILILVLALGAPDHARPGKGPAPGVAMLSARGPLQQLGEHPEWRQFIILAALRRADELAHLRELADDPVRETTPAPLEEKVAVIPVERGDLEPEDVTGSVNAAPAATLPMDIGETSSMELPNVHEETPLPVAKPPERVKPKIEAKKKTAQHVRRAKSSSKASAKASNKSAAKPSGKKAAKPPEPSNIFEAIFGSPETRQASTATTPAGATANRADTQTR